MPMIFRSPNLKLDSAEFHVAVMLRRGRASVVHKFRRSDREMWQPLCDWPGAKPKGLHRIFKPYRHGINVAMAGAACP